MKMGFKVGIVSVMLMFLFVCAFIPAFALANSMEVEKTVVQGKMCRTQR